MIDDDPIEGALASLDTPPLNARFAARVAARARLELGPPRQPKAGGSGLFIGWGPRLVPALLTLAAVAQTVATTCTAAKIYATAQTASSR